MVMALPGKGDKLSQVEMLYLTLLAQGLSRKQAAGQLNVATKTTEYYSSEIRRKLSAKTMTHAVAIVIRRGMI